MTAVVDKLLPKCIANMENMAENSRVLFQLSHEVKAERINFLFTVVCECLNH